MCEVQLLPLCTDSLEGGEAFSNGFSSEMARWGKKLSLWFRLPFLDKFQRRFMQELGLPERKPACDD